MKTRNVRRLQAMRWERWWWGHAGQNWHLPLSVQAQVRKVATRNVVRR